MKHHNGADSPSRDPFTLCVAEWSIAMRVCARCRRIQAFFFPTSCSAGHCRAGAWQPGSDLPLAETGHPAQHLSITMPWRRAGIVSVIAGNRYNVAKRKLGVNTGSGWCQWPVGKGVKRVCGKMWVGGVCRMNERAFNWRWRRAGGLRGGEHALQCIWGSYCVYIYVCIIMFFFIFAYFCQLNALHVKEPIKPRIHAPNQFWSRCIHSQNNCSFI